ncbi:MAG: type VI secretion system contractile sheath large subunit [Pirellulaceae bacterium]|nr:type VI secretion system contractile sheath large subunit [Pirellulaceae bacterium]
MNSASSHNSSQGAAIVEYVDGAANALELPPSLLDELVRSSSAVKAGGASPPQATASAAQLNAFLKASTIEEALRLWLGDSAIERLAGTAWSTIARQLQASIARIDRMLSDQVSSIIHHPDFQKLEASWRGLEYLVRAKDEGGDAPIKIRVLNASYAELCRDFDKAVEFDQSQLFQKIYEQEFGSPGGEPFGVLLADYEIHPRPSRHHPHDDMAMLRSFSQVAAAAFCPIVLNASPNMFGHDDYGQMQATVDYEKIHQDLSFLSWRSFRETEDSRFIGLAMPRMLLRRQYADRTDREGDFPYVERINGHEDCLWGGAAFAMGEVLMRSFAESRWLANIRGAQRADGGGGIVTGIGPEYFATDSPHVTHKPLTELQVADSLERQVVDLGFIPLCSCKDMPMAAFYSCPSAQKAKTYHEADATVNARMSAMLNYILCVSRFAHYLKVIGRDKVGSLLDAAVLQQQLQNWINDYVTADSEADTRIKARYPLREAELQVVPVPGKAGAFDCIFRLAPHYELEDMQASIKLRTELIRSF